MTKKLDNTDYKPYVEDIPMIESEEEGEIKPKKKNKGKQCHLCNDFFRTDIILKVHIKDNHKPIKKGKKEKPQTNLVEKSKSKCPDSHLCSDCGIDVSHETVKKISRFPKHIKRCRVDNFTCDCPEMKNYSFTYRKSHKQQVLNIVDRQRFKIKKWHLLIVHQGYLGCHAMSQCYLICETKALLEKHIQDNHPESSQHIQFHDFECEFCEMRFNKCLTVAKRTKDVMDHFDCIKQEFDKHVMNHRVKSFQCSCPNLPRIGNDGKGATGKRTSQYFLQLEQHMMVQHGSWKGCTICHEYFLSTEDLEVHKVKHKLALCNLCSKSFYNVKSHVEVVHNKNPSFIPKRKDRGILKKSPQCGERFSQLQSHIDNKHTADSEKNFSCQECGKGFSVRQIISSHMMSVHIKSRPHHCRYGCENSYNDVHNRAAHERRRHGQIFTKRAG